MHANSSLKNHQNRRLCRKAAQAKANGALVIRERMQLSAAVPLYARNIVPVQQVEVYDSLAHSAVMQDYAPFWAYILAWALGNLEVDDMGRTRTALLLSVTDAMLAAGSEAQDALVVVYDMSANINGDYVSDHAQRRACVIGHLVACGFL